MGDVNDIIQGALQSIGHHVHDELDVTVEEGDGSKARELVHWLSGLVDEADDADEEGGERGVGGEVFESDVEDSEEDGDERVLESTVKLIGKAINARAGASACMLQGQFQLLRAKKAIAIKTFCKQG